MQLTKFLNTNFLLFLILLLSLFLRINRVIDIPPSLNWDEVSIGYNAYSILKTGRDEWNQILPLHFKAYGEYKLPAQVYFSIPGIAIFGLNEFGVRVTPVIYGTLTVLFLFFLAKELSGNKWIGLISAFLLAISPWHIQLTRASFESSFSVMWVVLGIWFMVKGLKDKKWWVFSTLPLALAIYTYNAARVFTPLFLITTFFIYRKEVLKDLKLFTVSCLLLVVLMIPLAAFFLSGEATARLSLVSITDDPGFVLRINEARGNLNLPEPIPILVHNKVTHFAYVFTKNYLSHFTPSYLFVSGAGHKQHHVQNIGQLYLFQAPFVLIGLIYLFSKRNKFRWLIVSWILLSFIPVSITIDSIPHALRTLIAAPAYQIVTAFGLYATFKYLKKKEEVWLFVGGGVVALNCRFNIYGYINNY